MLGDAAATEVVVDGPSQLRFRVPPQKAPGQRTLTVRDAEGLAQAPFKIVPPPLSALGPCEITTVGSGLAMSATAAPETTATSGDGGPVSAARFAGAVAIAVDRNVVVYVLDDFGIVRAIRAGCGE